MGVTFSFEYPIDGTVKASLDLREEELRGGEAPKGIVRTQVIHKEVEAAQQ